MKLPATWPFPPSGNSEGEAKDQRAAQRGKQTRKLAAGEESGSRWQTRRGNVMAGSKRLGQVSTHKATARVAPCRRPPLTDIPDAPF